MEKFYHNDFEDLLKEKADQYKMYPSDKVWKGIHGSLHSRRKWYWSGFVLLLSGISYFAITELVSPVSATKLTAVKSIQPAALPVVSAEELIPFTSSIQMSNRIPGEHIMASVNNTDMAEGSEMLTGSFEVPLNEADDNEVGTNHQLPPSILITRPNPFSEPSLFNIELKWPVTDNHWQESGVTSATDQPKNILTPETLPAEQDKNRINWLQEHAAFTLPKAKTKKISWQLAFSPTINYRKLTGNGNARMKSLLRNVPMALNIQGKAENLVNHKPALGFELGSHALYTVAKNLNLKAGIQFNYSKYDITAFSGPTEEATINLNNTRPGASSGILSSYSSIRNFGGSAVKDLSNQYFQISVPVGLELRLLGNDKLQLNIAATAQPTYLLNANTYLITTDYKNYAKEPSLVRKWNVNTSAEAFISYTKAGVKWRVGPQFRYQLFSSYTNEYPIKEYLMEYGIKIGITKTIR